jgi:hypothetical protein
MPLKLRLILIFSIVVFLYQLSWAEGLIQAPAVIQVSSTVSDGKHTIPEIVAIAKENNLKVVILTDSVLMRWQYGIWPLRNILKKTVEQNSIFKYGIKRYLAQIENMQKANPDMVLLAGFECAPFYYWQGNIFDKGLKMSDWYKHILVMGLENVKDYKNLPILGNNQGLALPLRFKNILNLWPVFILAIGILCFNKRKFNYNDFQGQQLGPYSRPWRVVGVFLIIIGLLFSLNNYPFSDIKLDQYHGDLGIMPYQNFINYVHQRGGLTFWAHPEAQNIQEAYNVKIVTKEYTSDLAQAYNYTGFAIFYEGYTMVGSPGGLWDDMLKEYCQGKRSSPVWIISGSSYDSSGSLSEYMKDLKTVFLVPNLSKQEVLNSLKKGRMYVIRGTYSSQFTLDKFIIKGNSSAVEKTIGQEIELEGEPTLEIAGHFLNGRAQPFKIKLIRNGKIIETIETHSPFNISYKDEYNNKDKKSYYRIDLESEGIHLVTNPIFITQTAK